MTFFSKQTIAVAGVVLLATSAGVAQATTVDFGSKISGVASAPSFADFATLSVSGDGTDVLNFTLTLDSGFTSAFGSNAYLGALAFNGLESGIPKPTISDVSGGVSQVKYNSANGPASAYDFSFTFGQNANDRLVGGESVSWTASFDKTVKLSVCIEYEHGQCTETGTQNVLQPFDVTLASSAFAAQVNGIGRSGEGEGGTRSAWYAPAAAVPEPESDALLLAGLGLVVAVVRRRRAA